MVHDGFNVWTESARAGLGVTVLPPFSVERELAEVAAAALVVSVRYDVGRRHGACVAQLRTLLGRRFHARR